MSNHPLSQYFSPNEDNPPTPQKPFFLQDTDTSSPPTTPISPPPSDIKDPSSKIQTPNSKIQIPNSPIPLPSSPVPVPVPPSLVPLPTSHSPFSILHFPFSKSLPLLIIPIVISTFLISIYYNANQNRQPKTSSRAAQPTPPITKNASSSGFGNLASTSPQPSTDNLPARNVSQGDAGGQPTTYNLQPTTSNPLPPQSNSRIPFTVTLEADAFTPAVLEAEAGQIISISVTAQDKFYNVAIPDLGLSNTIPKGSARMMEFQATKPGRYTITSPDSPATATLIIK